MGRQGLEGRYSKAFTDGLVSWEKSRGYTNRSEWARKIGVPVSTLRGWLNGAKVMPDLPGLVALLEREPLSFEWLFFRRGARERGMSVGRKALSTDLRTALINHLADGRTTREAREIDAFLPRGEALLAAVIEAAQQIVATRRAERVRQVKRDRLRILRRNAKEALAIKDEIDEDSVSAIQRKRLDKQLRFTIDAVDSGAKALLDPVDYVLGIEDEPLLSEAANELRSR